MRPAARATLRRGAASLGWILLAAAPLAGCGGAGHDTPPPRLVILYATCSLNKTYLAPYDSTVTDTPNLARFGGQAAVLQRHMTETGVSGPAYASILTGTQADRHGIYSHPTPLAEDGYLVSEAFAAAGYEPFFWSGHPMAGAALGYGQGVPPQNVVFTKGSGTPADRDRLTALDDRFAAILDHLERDPSYRAYVQIEFTLTHGPYDRRTTPRERGAFLAAHPEAAGGLSVADLDRYLDLYTRNSFQLTWNFPETAARLGLTPEDVAGLARTLDLTYRVAVAALDRQFGALLDRIHRHGLDGASLIVFTSDHGEILYRQNAFFHWTHGKQLAPEVLEVPCLIRGAGVRPGPYDKVTRSVDLFPTLAGLSGVSLPRGLDLPGRDLSGALRGTEPEPDLIAYAHTSLLAPEEYRRPPGLALRNTLHPAPDPRYIWTLIRDRDTVFQLCRELSGDWHVQVFDWATDRGETRDLYDPKDPEHAARKQDLLAAKLRLEDGFAREEADTTVAARQERLERLRSLGYVN